MLMAAIAMLGGISVLLFCWRCYEIAIGLILLSPWVNWLLNANVAKTAEETIAVGKSSYLRILLVALVGSCGAVQFLRSWFTGQVRNFPKYGPG